MHFHPLSNHDVLCPMITSDTTRLSMFLHCLKKQDENGLSTVIRVNTSASDEATFAVNEGVCDQLPADKAYESGQHWIQCIIRIEYHHVDHHDGQENLPQQRGRCDGG